jgi:hypothetical protein
MELIMPPPSRQRHLLARLEPRALTVVTYYVAATVLGIVGYAVAGVLRGQQKLRRLNHRSR